MRRVVASTIAMALALGMLAVAAPANAYWHSAGTGSGVASTGSLAPPTAVTGTSGEPGDAILTWVASGGPVAPDGYYVERSAAAGTEAACGSSPATLLVTTTCTDEGVAAGTYTYRVIAVFRSWTATSAPSSPVSVADSLLGAATLFSVLGTAVTTTGFTRVSGDLGTSPGVAVVGFPDGVVSGDIHAGDATSAAAALARSSAYAELMARPFDALIDGDLIGQVFTPGVYYAGAALGLTGILTLDGGGDPNAVFIFQADAAVGIAESSSMVLINQANASNVYWVVNAAVTTGASSRFVGTILAQGAITLGASAQLIGRALSADAVTMANNEVRFTELPGPILSIGGGTTAVTKDTTPTITGTTTAAAGRTVTVTVAAQLLTTTVQADQTWSVVAADLLAGTYGIVAKLRDSDGNGATATQSLLVEVSPPTVALAAAAPFSVLAGTTITSTGVSSIAGEVGDATAVDALAALDAAIDDAGSRLAHTEFAGDLVGAILHAGVHHSTGAITLSGPMTLDAEGDPGAVFIIQVDAAMTTAAFSTVTLENGAQASNVFWVIDGAITTGAQSSLSGTLLATATITLGAGTHLIGRALTLGGVVMDSTTITSPE